ncbi:MULTISPECIES: ATP-dependent Clp protease adaptor ClpS [Weeksella]|uniref:ATP-dependent Clp protease adaptor protein ClpS n=1 Tax=Weeksella virosa (strain ATCC 43766 / DSM 16922 / JCM 21250 / CCUG 30538 / CDC 9751 / IAM 14551 / NBRC 16016 / NCTC 11634 / CL345/78) TaxID=865938 RepID=F0NYR6_WEEVC|nr:MULTISPECIES: ATP-dependent Clp protease adaptor ClpS [Weeksella]ADX68197.1 ATP-dependent Clp protease adaptor protein ClpS [Weeksella virosa DSM 16922]MDK7374700.1 ATP-dependent Clp protease adaptor ClpS [Weeksella virosa]MDK7674848.1 ATP-dependent Clp protease adaptor ClpS [Weeksella virosa]OFM83279.1 Clp protease ClpS [Weeksella sp. HMSC059D05]SUP54510.1 ATP-dependent Clp protease adaptor [Weeksella virosa]
MYFNVKPLIETSPETDIEVLTEEKEQNQIIVHNDDVNTFDWVIESLIDVCDHTPEQAEQCTLIIHYNGKCDVLTGEYTYLKPRCEELLNRGISAEIV